MHILLADDNPLFLDGLRNLLLARGSGYLLKSLEANRFCSLLVGILRGEAVMVPGVADALLTEFSRSAAPGGEI